MAWKIVYYVLLFATVARGSIVRDSHTDKNGILDEYCPKSENCEEGAHVMCMYYNPNSIMGPQCHKSKDLHITADEAAQILDLANLIRGYIARGEETGQDGVKLPRAYGMMRVAWDEELATFAQVLANQCILRHDLCRASKKFPEPGQTAGIVRFTYPDWYSITGTENFTAGLSDEKLMYSVRHIFETWYSLKSSVTPDLITSYPDWTVNPDKATGRLYIEMIHGKSTHMGCGISAYADYAYHANNADLTYNNVQVICNFSSRSRTGELVYNTHPPTDTDVGYTLRCGCPVGYDEDANCLCYRSDRSNPKTCENDQCKPSVVLLPIFTVEDAPAHKMIHTRGAENNTLSLTDSFEIFDHYDKFTKKPHLQISPHHLYNEDHTRKSQRNFNLHKHVNVGRRYFDRPNTKKSYPYTSAKRIFPPKQLKKHRNGKSIFSRTAIFELPKRKLITKAPTRALIKKDVIPRKDFTNVRKLVTTYLNHRRINGNNLHSTHLNKEIKLINNSLLEEHEITTENYIKTTMNVIKFNQYLKDKTYSNSNATKHLSLNIGRENDADNNVLILLNDLKTELKHTDFDKKEKEIFDAKLRQIYDTLAINHFEDKLSVDLDFRNNSIKNEKYRTFDANQIGEDNNKYPNYSYDRLFHKKDSSNNAYNREENDNKRMNEDTSNENKVSKIYGIRRRNKDFYRRNGNDVLRSNYYLRKQNLDEVLSSDRRRYYQEKLDNLERKLYNMRGYKRKHVVSEDRLLRPMKLVNEVDRRRPEDSSIFYMPDRARFLHGF